jgi:predicted esterase
MSGERYFRFLHRALGLYRAGEFKDAYDLVRAEGAQVGGNQAQVANLEYCLACRLGMKEESLRVLRKAVVSDGYWYGYEYLLKDEDLAGIRESAEFLELAAICREREAEALRTALPALEVHDPNVGSDRPKGLLVALHGNGDGVALNRAQWIDALDAGYLLAMPQSSQLSGWGARTWQDLGKGREELRSHMRALEGKGQGRPFVLGGFSGGARLALRCVLSGDVRPDMVILVSPWLPELEEWRPLLAALDGASMACHVFCGSCDADCKDGARNAAEMLSDAGVATEFHLVEGLDHDYPEDFAGLLHGRLPRVPP